MDLFSKKNIKPKNKIVKRITTKIIVLKIIAPSNHIESKFVTFFFDNFPIFGINISQLRNKKMDI